MYKTLLGQRLKELRGTSSQSEMADAIGIKWQSWARYERGEVAPGAEIIANICRIHACSADWLLGLKDNGGVNVKADNGAAVAVGTNARATTTTVMPSGESSACKKCPHLKKLKKFEALLKK
jgi:DNA-binding XRE family transcriptional regulator